MRIRRWPLAAFVSFVTVVALAVAGCSSSGSPSSSGRAAASHARGLVLTAARGLYQKLFDAGAASVRSMSGFYLPCGNSSTKRYYQADISLFPVDHHVSLAAYRQQVTNLAHADGWQLTKESGPSPLGTGSVRYRITRGSLSGSLSVFHSTSPPVEGSVSVLSLCFDAGSYASSLTGHVQNIPLPFRSP